MKNVAIVLLFLLSLLLAACGAPTPLPTEPATQPETEITTAPPETTLPPTVPPQTEPESVPPETTVAIPVPVVELTEEEKTLLLKIGMAELGHGECTECIALVMRTVLNRVEADRFGSSVRSVLFAPEQFTPVMDGTYDSSQPNERCYDALEMVIYGWDESQGALYYEFCEGESWHSQNLHLLFQHCDTRFYD